MPSRVAKYVMGLPTWGEKTTPRPLVDARAQWPDLCAGVPADRSFYHYKGNFQYETRENTDSWHFPASCVGEPRFDVFGDCLIDFGNIAVELLMPTRPDGPTTGCIWWDCHDIPSLAEMTRFVPITFMLDHREAHELTAYAPSNLPNNEIFDLGAAVEMAGSFAADAGDRVGQWDEIAAILGRVAVLFSFATADPVLVEVEPASPKLKAAARKKNRPIADSTVRILLTHLRYQRNRWTGNAGAKGVRWHMVRGHYATLRDPKWGDKVGSKVWRSAHSRGNKHLGRVDHTYELESPNAPRIKELTHA